jgi:hypothetical protein
MRKFIPLDYQRRLPLQIGLFAPKQPSGGLRRHRLFMAKETRDFLRGSRADIVRVGAGGADRQLSKSLLGGDTKRTGSGRL